MKMQYKILSLAVLPLVLLGVVILVSSNAKINSVVTSSIENGLKTAAVSVRDTFAYADEGDYQLDRYNNLCKGDFNISKNVAIADNIKEATNIDITVFYGDVRFMTSIVSESGNRMVGTKAGETVVDIVLKKGGEYFSNNVDIYGQKYFGYYIPIQNNDGEIVGMIFAGMPQADARAQILSILSLIVIIVVATGVLGAIVLVFVVRKLVKALEKGCDALEELAQGKLDVQLDNTILNRKDEIGKISRSIMKLKTELSSVIGTMKNHSEALSTSATFLNKKTVETAGTISQVERAIGEVADGATSQAQETQNATDNVIHIGKMVEDTTKEAETMHKNALDMKKLGEEAFATLHELQDINSQARESIDIIYEQTNNTNQSVQKIREATGLITAIAEETNLLSLNASIEAARAGEQGRGFAVVASQIQKLAEQSNASASHIEEIITYLITDSDKAVKTMDVVKDIMDKQNEKVHTTDMRFGEVLKGIETSMEAIDRIVEQTGQMDKTRITVVDSVRSLTAIAEQNAASTQETSASVTEIANTVADISGKAGHLKSIAEEMDKSMEIFKL
ncbi:MAG: cache domain-containing protein [Lachnospiraceae bacterium]|nr:cache domain-containing protein [Lachnospiraceae bacterium]